MIKIWTRHFLVFIVSMCLATLSVAAPSIDNPDANAWRAEIRKILALPEDQIDIGFAALMFAKEIYPNIDVAVYSKKIDDLAAKVRWLAANTKDPEQRIRALNTVIYRQEGYRYDRDPFSRSRREYYFLNGILDTKRGICYTMPLLYMAVAQRLGYPIYMVIAPDHMFLRYVDPAFSEQNIETTSGGKYFSDDSYIKDFAVGKQGFQSGAYMRTLTYRESLGRLISANAFALAEMKQGHRAISYLQKAVEIDAKDVISYWNLQSAFSSLGEQTRGPLKQKYQNQAKAYADKTAALGYVDPARVANERRIRGL